MHGAPSTLAKLEPTCELSRFSAELIQVSSGSLLPATVSFYTISEHAADATHSQLWWSDLIKFCMAPPQMIQNSLWITAGCGNSVGTLRKHCIGVNKLKGSQLMFLHLGHSRSSPQIKLRPGNQKLTVPCCCSP